MEQNIEARCIIQIAGKPKEHVDKALHKVLETLNEEKTKFKILESELVESDLDEKTRLFAGFIEMLIKFKNVNEILLFITNYTPTSIIIESPRNLKIDSQEFTGILNDVSNMILKSQMDIRKLNAHIYSLQKQLDSKK